MLDRPAPTDLPARDSTLFLRPRWPFAFVGAAGLLGAAGVMVGAAGAHGGAGGADLARTSSEFLLLHAAAVLAGAGVAWGAGQTGALLPLALALLCVGAALFGGEVALAALLQWRPVPLAAPAGGLCLVAGWLCLAVWAAASVLSGGRAHGRA